MRRIGIAFGSGGMTPSETVECAKLAEDCGYESAWVIEGHGGDQFSILTACALATRKIHLGTAITSIFVRTAPTIAMATACVDHFSNHRFILGLGSSHKVQVEDEHGVPYGKPVTRTRETIDVIRTLLRDGRVSYSGQTVSIKNFDFWFAPSHRSVPIYVAAVFPQMLELCGEIADGVIMVWRTIESARAAAEMIAKGAKAAGRDPKAVEITSLLPACVHENGDVARGRMRPMVAFYAGFFPRYSRLMAETGFAGPAAAIREAWQSGDREEAARRVPDEMINALAIAGTPQECRERIESYQSSSIQVPIVFPVAEAADNQRRVMELIKACAA